MGRAGILIIVAGFVVVGVVAAIGAGAGPVAAADDFVAGSGEASAVVLHAGPIGSNLRATINYGESLADFAGTVGRAQSATTDLGLYGLMLTTPLCPGQPPPVDRKQLPAMAYARTGDPGAADGKRVTTATTPPTSPVQATVGDEQAWATADPTGRAVTTLAAVDAARAIAFTGGRSEARSQLLGHTGRESKATSELATLDLAGGLVHLEHLRWEAVQHSDARGKIDRATGSFSVGRAMVAGAGVDAPRTDVGSSLDAINKALAPTGIRLSAPQVTVKDGVVNVSPMSVDFVDSPAAQATVGAVLNAVQPVRQPVGDAVSNESCNAAMLYEVADIGSAGVGGHGSFLFDLGGVSAGTEANRYANPLVAPGIDLPNVAPGQPAAGPAVATPSVASAVPASPVVVPGTAASPPSARLTGHRTRHDGPRSLPTIGRGAAVAAGGLGLAATFGIALADWAHLRGGGTVVG